MIIGKRRAKHSILHKDPAAYCGHPQIIVAGNGDWLVVFNKAPRRAFILHPPEDPEFRNVLIRSRDRGTSWSIPRAIPSDAYSGTECAALTPLQDGSVMLHQWQFAWYSLAEARTLPDQANLTYPDRYMRGWLDSPEHETSAYRAVAPEDLAPWVRGPGRAFIHFSSDYGASFTRTVEIDTAPFSGGYGMRRALQLPDDEIILPLSDVPHYRTVFIVVSKDNGRT